MCESIMLFPVTAGSQLLTRKSISDVAQLYFFVNRSETDKWMLRTCELRARVAFVAASQHVALHAAFTWLLQLLSAARHFAITSSAKKSTEQDEAAAKSSRAVQSSGLEVGGIEAVAPKPVKILRPQHPPEASKPRSVVKVQYQRKQDAPEQKRSSSGNEGPAVAEEVPPSAPAKGESAAALKIPKRLLLSAMQLAYLLCGILEELQETTELTRLHVVLSAALEPLLKQLTELEEQAQAKEAQENDPAAAYVAVGRHTSAADLLAYVLGSAMRVEGRYEEAVLQFTTSLSAGMGAPAVPPEHTQFCMQQVARCYAALNDWKQLGTGWQTQGLAVSAGFELQSKLQGLQVWQPIATPHAATDESQGRLRTDSKPLNVATILDEPVMKAHAAVSALFPSPPRSGQPQNITSAVCNLGEVFDTVLQELSGAVAPVSANMAAEYVSLMHAGAAMSQLLIARLPPGSAEPKLPLWLQDATAAQDPCQHLLAASSILAVDVQGSAALAACDALRRRSCVLSEALQTGFSGRHKAALDAAQLPLHTLIFSVACKLASAQEYSLFGTAGTNSKLPTKEAALQVCESPYVTPQCGFHQMCVKGHLMSS